MKKCRFVCVFCALLILLTACGRETAEPETAGVQESTEASMESQEPEELQETESRNLIVYFSRWGNTEFPDDVDADSYASIVISGDNEYGITEYIARFIQENAGGDIHLIQTAEPYPVDFEVLREQNVEEMDTGFLPELKESSLDLSAYDTVFIGYPIWAMDAPQAIFSFLAENDLTGKRIVPFCTHHGYGAGSSYQHIAETVPGASEVFEGFAIDGDKLENAENEVIEWLRTIGMLQEEQGFGNINEISYTTEEGETGFVYAADEVLNHPEQKVPLVLAMCGTGQDTRRDAQDMGWVKKAQEEGFIVLAPDYNNASTYSETDTIASVVEYVIQNYPVDRTRVYSTGFSNGGALSVALCRDYPQLFAGIAAFGWMVDMPDKDGVYVAYDMPFQLIQGTKEFTVQTDSGAMAVMRDEQQALRALFLMNEMIEENTEPDYTAVPYWGYAPDETSTAEPDGREWQFDDYYKDGYPGAFAQLVLIEGAEHTPNQYEAEAAWEFLKRYARDEDGRIIAAPSNAGGGEVSEGQRILISYFSRSGNTEKVAQEIERQTGGTLFEIVPEEPYPDDYDETVERFRRERDEDARPEVAGTVEGMDSYDIVFVGFPIWGGDIPYVVRTFLEQYDLDGKTVVPFCTHGGSRFGSSLGTLEGLCPDSEILEGYEVSGSSAGNVEDEISDWLKEIEIVN